MCISNAKYYHAFLCPLHMLGCTCTLFIKISYFPREMSTHAQRRWVLEVKRWRVSSSTGAFLSAHLRGLLSGRFPAAAALPSSGSVLSELSALLLQMISRFAEPGCQRRGGPTPAASALLWARLSGPATCGSGLHVPPRGIQLGGRREGISGTPT